MANTYTIAMRDAFEAFTPVQGIPRDMTLEQAQVLSQKARDNGFDCVAFNVESE